MAPSPDHPFLATCRGEPTSRVPVWFMRQAGRSLPEYNERKGDLSILDAVEMPELAAELTLQPVKRYGVDAAIFYSDIVVPARAIGFGIEIVAGVGPVAEHPFRTAADLDRLPQFEPAEHAPYIAQTVELLVRELGDTPLIGFAGAPFTVASYLIEGKPSRTYEQTKRMMFAEPELFHQLLDRLADIALASLRDQVEAGASAVQLFDSWAGALDPATYERFVLPHSRRVLEGVADLGVPRIHFGVGTGEILGLMSDAGADVVGVDWRVPLDAARERVPGKAVQGNLDPAIVFAGWDATEQAIDDVLARNAGRPGHVFNLGHGVLPGSDPGILRQVVDHVHERG
ncbi:uroporphyrinogen decarboxylase [Actinospongicola halichondriae]|uniref:uroporphyrinogen decarboxylase n=1 Tax=Actinospongicola halichondriae TaxID=3236844 RepID=UPI003D50D261